MSLHHQLVPVLRWLFSANVLDPDGIEARARMLLLDTIGCMVAGLTASPVAQFVREMALLSPGPIALGRDASVAAPALAQAGAIAATWDEACEGLARAHGRPGVPVVASVIALACARSLPLRAALEAIVAGYETGGRMGEVLRNRPGMHVDAGWPSLGAAVGAARALGLNADEALAAVETVACQLPVGLYAPVRAGATARNTYLAHAASLGLSSALAVHAGMDAPETALADHAAIALGLAPDTLRIAPAGEYLLREGYLKAFAAVRHVHYGATAALALRDRLYTRLADVTGIELATYPEAIRYCGNRAPQTPIAAQFSLAFGVAAALRFGEVAPAAYRAPQFAEGGVRRLEALVRIIEAPDLAGGSEDGRRGAHLTVRMGDDVHRITVHDVKGDAAWPFTADDCRAKFVQYAGPSIGSDRAQAVADAILDGPTDRPMTAVWNLLW